MDFGKLHFGSIAIDGATYEHDVVIDRGKIRKRKKKPSKKFREEFGCTSSEQLGQRRAENKRGLSHRDYGLGDGLMVKPAS